MNILAFMGSPRMGGNTDILLTSFLEAAESRGADVTRINLATQNISPCTECGGCDKTGTCVLQDDMTDIYPSIAAADALIVASPIFFYNITAYTQALVERSQACWVSKYVLRKGFLGGKRRIGIFLSLGATKGKLLFDGVLRVIRYFFDAVDADFAGSLLYRGIEKRGEVRIHPSALEEAQTLGRALASGSDIRKIDFLHRRTS